MSGNKFDKFIYLQDKLLIRESDPCPSPFNLMRLIRWSLEGWTGLTNRGSWHTVSMIWYILSFLLESRFLGLLANHQGTDYLVEEYKSQKALIKSEVVKPQQVIAVSVKSPSSILEDGRGFVVAEIPIFSAKGPMYQSFNCAKRRFYSTNSIDIWLDEGVDLRKKVEIIALSFPRGTLILYKQRNKIIRWIGFLHSYPYQHPFVIISNMKRPLFYPQIHFIAKAMKWIGGQVLGFFSNKKVTGDLLISGISRGYHLGRGQTCFYSSALCLKSAKYILEPGWITGFVNGEQTNLVLWGTNLSSSLGNRRITKQESNMIKLPPYQYSVVIGLLLSDGWLTFSNSRNTNARLGFLQSATNFNYLWFVFNILSHYCTSLPVYRTRKYRGRANYSIHFFTRALPCFTSLHSLFYLSGVKVIPDNIYELLTPVALAHIVMGDGSVSRSGLMICTDSYSIEEVVRLINVLIIRYRLECTIRVHRKNQYRIYIRQNSMASLVSIVFPYIHFSMLYKFNTLNAKHSSPLLNKERIASLGGKNQSNQISKFHKRLYSSAVKQDLADSSNKYSLNPWFVTGFIDGEGCFNINIVKNKNYKTGFSVEVRFSIGLRAEDKPILELIKNNLNVGSVIKEGSQFFKFRLSSVKDLEVLINHLDKYPLLTKKYADYILWKKVFNIVKKKEHRVPPPSLDRERGGTWCSSHPLSIERGWAEHLTIEGLQKIVEIKASLNWGLSSKLKSYFPDIVSVERPLVKNNQILDPNWIAGFTTAEGSFLIRYVNTPGRSVSVQLVFQLVQHSRDRELIYRIKEYFDCGAVYQDRESFKIMVTKFSSLRDKIIPFFKKYPILGLKSQDFEDWCKVAELINNKTHLTPSGLQEILKIKAGKNKRRKVNISHFIESNSNLMKENGLSYFEEVWEKLWDRAFKNPNKVHYDLRGYLKDINLWILAHKIIVQNTELRLDFEYTSHRILTWAEMDKILSIQKQVLEGCYNFSPVRSHISNKACLGKIFMWKSSYSDNLVETVLFLILEPIFAVRFDKNSMAMAKFSLDTKRYMPAHSAIKYISTKYISERWVIKGNISKCFENTRILMNILLEKIRDKLILNLIKSSFNNKIYYEELWYLEVIGIRQTGKLFVLLCDILLYKLDKKIREWDNLDNCHNGRSNILYVRYSNNLILLCGSSRNKAKEFKHKLSFYIENILNLKLQTDMRVKDGRKGFKFLGFNFKIHVVNYNPCQIIYRKKTALLIYIDIPKVFQLLTYLGFCNKKGFPMERRDFFHKTQSETNNIMIFILNKFKNWFSLAKNRQRALDAVYHVIIFSLAKTYAGKYKLKTVRRTFAIAGKELNKPLKVDDIRKTLRLKEHSYNLPAVRKKDYNISLAFGEAKANTSKFNIVMTDFNVRHDFLATVYPKNIRLYSLYLSPILSPWFITGFTDGEGSFLIIIRKKSDTKIGFRVEVRFQIELNRKDEGLLKLIQAYFGGIGVIYRVAKDCLAFRVSTLDHLVKIIDHFDKYPLITQKLADYKLFCYVVAMMRLKEHLTQEGLEKIVAIKKSHNLGLSEKLQAAFPNIIPVSRPKVENKKIPHGEWLAGFVSGEGCFFVNIKKKSNLSTGFQVILNIQVTQHIRDEELLKSFVYYLGCGGYNNIKNKHGVWVASGLSDILNILIPFFHKYPIRGVKGEDFKDWCRVAKLMKDKKHLTLSGLEEIREIKAGMNRNRPV